MVRKVPLQELELSIDDLTVPSQLQPLLAEASRRVADFSQKRPDPRSGFVPCGFETVARALQLIQAQQLATGRSFCEWGSGFGVVASVAALMGFDAMGIEIDEQLIEQARQLADDFSVPVDFFQGSFVPPGGEYVAERANGDFFWLESDSDDTYEELGLGPDDFDLIFAYPWPEEETVIDVLFEKFAAHGALLLTYSQFDSVRLRRKISSRSMVDG